MQVLKNLLFLFIAIFLLEACSGPSETAFEPQEIIDSTLTEEEEFHRVTPQEYIEHPFTASVIGKKGWTTDEKILPNHNNEESHDTLITMRFKESIIHFHNHDLLDVFLVNNEIHLMNHIHVGMARDSFDLVFINLKDHSDAPYVRVSDELVEMGCCSEKNDLWMFHFDADTIYQIDYNGYVD